MKLWHALLVTGALLSTGCPGDDGVATIRKGEVDEGALVAGVTVSIDAASGTGTVLVPFVEPVPQVPDEDFEDEMDGAVMLQVQSPRSGAQAELLAGTLVDGDPSAPGEYSWELNEDRDEAMMTFFNQTPGGLTLKPGLNYDVQLTVSTNMYVENVSPIGFQANVN